MQNKTIDINKIEPNSYNPNEMVDSTFDYLKHSKEWFGDLQDIVVWQKGDKYIIIDGEHRYKADKELNKKEINVKIITTEDLNQMAEKLINLSKIDIDYIQFSELENIQDKEKRAEFIIKTLTLTLNSIKGENNPIKLAELYKDMASLVPVSTLSSLMNTTEEEIKTYQLLLDMSDDKSEIKTITKAPKLNEIKLILNDQEYDTINKAIEKTLIQDKKDAILYICEEFLKDENNKEKNN